MTFMMPVMMLVMNGVSVLIVWTGAHGISDGQMQVGDMMAFIQYTMQIIMGFLMLCMISIMLPRAAVAADRVEEVLKSETMIHDPKQENISQKTEKEYLLSIMYLSVIQVQMKMFWKILHLQRSRGDNSDYRKYRKW